MGCKADRKSVITLIARAMAEENVEAELDELVSKLDVEDQLACSATHALQHFLDDADIRARDADYDDFCRRGLDEYLQKLGSFLVEWKS
jgi:hypothetical protein